VFTDPQAKERAQRKIEALRQGLRPFLEVFTEWQSLLLELGAGYWPDDAKKVALDRILSDDLAKAMITVPTQPDFDSYCAILKSTDDKLKAYKARAPKNKDLTTRTSPPTWKRLDDKRAFTVNNTASEPKIVRKASAESMEWEPTPVKVATTSTRRAKWVS